MEWDAAYTLSIDVSIGYSLYDFALRVLRKTVIPLRKSLPT